MLGRLRCLRFLNSNMKFTKSHQWVIYDPQTKSTKIGITNYAKEQLGQIVHIQFPKVGSKFTNGQSALVVQSVKIAADVYSPVAGTVKAVNEQLGSDLSIIENQPAENIWLIELLADSEPSGLLTREEAKKLEH